MQETVVKLNQPSLSVACSEEIRRGHVAKRRRRHKPLQQLHHSESQNQVTQSPSHVISSNSLPNIFLKLKIRAE